MRPQRLLLVLALATPVASWATPDFPEAIARDLHLSGSPACTICHATEAGGSGTVTKPFGKYLVSRGLVPFDEGSLAGALAAATAENHDSNGDGISDIEALQRGLDPNGSAGPGPSLEDPTFGCSVAPGADGGVWLLALIVGAFALRRRARRATASEGTTASRRRCSDTLPSTRRSR